MLHPLNPTIRPFAGNDLGHKPSAGAAGDPSEGEAQGVTEKLAVLAGVGVGGGSGWIWMPRPARAMRASRVARAV